MRSDLQCWLARRDGGATEEDVADFLRPLVEHEADRSFPELRQLVGGLLVELLEDQPVGDRVWTFIPEGPEDRTDGPLLTPKVATEHLEDGLAAVSRFGRQHGIVCHDPQQDIVHRGALPAPRIPGGGRPLADARS
ncbi:hypothetical protein [Rhizosaccharibacter radicis]|uniref:Uncharacterized protein n=1 Tax=Rhizosaccharibacter radicis TaxID=2782605 RepID=A0ABT1VYR8_9PROT|nr:hypothetical protein [Acetobacteraceae bacterium KSS12]